MDELRVVREVDATQYIVIGLGDEQYGVDIKYIDSILRMQRITRVPKVAPHLKGVINLRGEVIPVMSLRLKMNLSEDEITRATRIIILKLEQYGMIGIIVDEVKEVVTLTSDQIQKIAYDPKDENTNYINGVGKFDEELISLLDFNLVMQEKENA